MAVFGADGSPVAALAVTASGDRAVEELTADVVAIAQELSGALRA